MKNPTKSSLTNKLDKICSDIIRLNPCCNCSEPDRIKIQCAHIFSRSYRSVRWDLPNLLPLCASYHFYMHRNPVLFGEFVITHLGSAEYSELKRKARKIYQWKIFEMEDLLDHLKKEYQYRLVGLDIKNGLEKTNKVQV